MKKDEKKYNIEIQDQIQIKRNSFKCLLCNRYAKNPVVTLCGHMFCWPCLYKKIQSNPYCPTCKQLLISNQCYPIYTDSHEDNVQQNPISQKALTGNELSAELLPPRPAAKHRQKVFNPNIISAGLPITSNNLPDNVNMGNMMTGYVFLSSLSANSLNNIQIGVETDQDYVIGQKFRIKMHFIIIITILMVVFFLI